MSNSESKHLCAVTTICTALAVGAIASSAPAAAAPTGTSAPVVIDRLQSQGYTVVVNRTGAEPLEECSVLNVRQGQTHQTVDSRGGGSLNTTVISDTVYVDLAC